MVNESMISFYLSRIFDLPKEKFRFINQINYIDEGKVLLAQRAWDNKKTVHKPEAGVEMVKMVIEIIDDFQAIQDALLTIKTEIRDGSSLLYDLLPSHLCINMGYSGLATKNKLNECHLIKKQGRQVSGQDFVVSLLRSISNPYCFVITLLNFENGENYCLELQENDIFQLTEGK